MSIEVRHLTKTFGAFTALDGVDLKVADGELLALGRGEALGGAGGGGWCGAGYNAHAWDSVGSGGVRHPRSTGLGLPSPAAPSYGIPPRVLPWFEPGRLSLVPACTGPVDATRLRSGWPGHFLRGGLHLFFT